MPFLKDVFQICAFFQHSEQKKAILAMNFLTISCENFCKNFARIVIFVTQGNNLPA